METSRICHREGVRNVAAEQLLPEFESEAVFIAAFETLNWLDSLLYRPEVAPAVEGTLHEALWFIRGRVHHRWAEAIEFRKDVLVPPGFLGQSLGPAPPIVVSDWCWKNAETIPGGKRDGVDRGEREYRHLLAGRPTTRTVLDQVASVAGGLMADWHVDDLGRVGI